MADAKVKISELPTWVPVNTDYIPFVSWGVTKKGLKSDLKGDTGDNATATVGTTTTGAPWTDASVTNVGTTSDAIFDFVIPRGDVGATWPTWPEWPEWPAGSGTGDVIWPASSTDNAIARYDSTTGKLIQNSGVLIDDNNNVYTNNYFANITSTVSAAGTTILTVASSKTQRLTGASTQTFQLPVGTTLPLSSIFEFDNNSSSSLIITNAGATTLYTVPAGGAVVSQCTGNVTTNGVWDFHAMTPASVTWWSWVTGLIMNSVLTTSPSVGSGASSSTAPVFIPQRGANTTGFGGDGTSLYAIIAGIGRLIITSTGIGIRNVANTFTGSLTNTVTANRIYTLPDKTGTLATTEEPDFWKYVISRTVDGSGNMTTTLLNYLWATPSASAPVKIQVGGVVYTITSARSIVLNAGTNWMNLWSTELATKEVDLFSYLWYSTGTWWIVLLAGRNPNELTWAGNSFSPWDERFMQTVGGAGTVSPVVNIGRFNTILSAGAGYTWSIPTTSVVINSPTFTTITANQALVNATSNTWYLNIPQNSQSAAYTLISSDSGKHIYHPSADTTARTLTIDSNANVPYPIGTAITFVNDTSAGTLTIAITSDTLVLAGAGTTGNRTLTANWVATAIKVTSTRWIISGTSNLT